MEFLGVELLKTLYDIIVYLRSIVRQSLPQSDIYLTRPAPYTKNRVQLASSSVILHPNLVFYPTPNTRALLVSPLPFQRLLHPLPTSSCPPHGLQRGCRGHHVYRRGHAEVESPLQPPVLLPMRVSCATRRHFMHALHVGFLAARIASRLPDYSVCIFAWATASLTWRK